ncbi:MAG TPA: hypothetical protein VGQ84_10650 [Gaiellaceae bacterium]|nr:hypothetical protein [Gaiellaceae bacterium]
MKPTVVLLAAFLLAGCGSSAAKQAEALQSLAAEGALMAHDAGEGDEWKPYRSAHADELARQASSLRSTAKTVQLSRAAGLVARDLQRLEHADPRQARLIEKRLTRVAKLLGQLE